MPRRRLRRGGSPAAAAAPATGVSSAAVSPRQRQARSLRTLRAAEQLQRDAMPLLLRPVFALVPFLRYWGGFL